MTGPPTVATIVEGHGEVKAVPVLLRRLAGDLYDVHHIVVPPPFRVKRNKMTARDALSAAASVQAARVTGAGGVLVIADADDDCAVALADELRHAATPVPVEVAIAVREFEAWFVGAVESLRTHRSVRGDASYEGNPEAPRGAKGVLTGLMTEPYRETLHQPAFAALLDVHQAQRVRSFAHLARCLGRLIGAKSR